MRYASRIEPSQPLFRSRARAWTALSALSGALFALVAPPTSLVPVVWVSLAGLAYALDVHPRRASWLDGGGRGLAFGFGANVVLLRFVPAVIARFTPLPFAAGVLALVLLALAQGVPWGVAAVVRSALVRAKVPRPVGFALGVYASTFVPSVFPWTPAAGLTPWPALVQLADAIGERGVSALAALSAGLVAHAARAWIERRARGGAAGVNRSRANAPSLSLAIAVAVPLAMALHGRARIASVDELRRLAPTASIGLVDVLVPATTRWEPAAAPSILASLTQQTILAEERGADVTIWPESAYPYILSRGSKASPPGNERPLQHGVRGPLLVGAVTRDAKGERYNAALAVRSDGALTSEYDKLHLLWFGEEVPFATELPWLRQTFARGLGMVPGDRPQVLELGRVKAAPLICFEDILPEAGREAASVRPNLLVNLSNDAWFVGSREPETHLRAAVMRAIETRRDFVRAVNVGPTSFIDATGRIREAYSVDVPAALVVRAALLDGQTIYARFGDWPWLVAFAVVTGIFAATKRSERRTT
ncbi:MAG: apolipoprotein N-acyltransferase [Polyangiaceae bacterium]